jgi:SAM-dependent methyltransferase
MSRNTRVAAESAEHVGLISADAYLRSRLAPSIFDVHYPHLQDLLELIKCIAPELQGDLFDYGCGGAPYRSLFTRCRKYVGADMAPGSAVDRVLKQDGLTEELDESYDVVLSTQVLEHVKSPESYVRESYRILRPGGQLILTTHGMFEEHGCPYDFYRWTSAGLEELIRRCGFEVLQSRKLTTEIRAFVQLLNHMNEHLQYPRKPLIHFVLRLLRKLYRIIGMPLLNWCSRFFGEQGIVEGSNQAGIYSCIYVRARKPGANPG